MAMARFGWLRISLTLVASVTLPLACGGSSNDNLFGGSGGSNNDASAGAAGTASGGTSGSAGSQSGGSGGGSGAATGGTGGSSGGGAGGTAGSGATGGGAGATGTGGSAGTGATGGGAGATGTGGGAGATGTGGAAGAAGTGGAAGAAGSGGSAGAGGAPVTLVCGNTSCSAPSECCVAADTGGYPPPPATYSCFDPANGGTCTCSGIGCHHTTIGCGGPLDCPSGQVCCGTYSYTSQSYTELQCAGSCSNGQFEMCKPNDGVLCSDAQAQCRQSQVLDGYYYCQ